MLTAIPLLLALAIGTVDERTILTDRPNPRPLPLPSQEDAFGFAVFGDRTGGPADGVQVLAEAVEEVNWLGPDLVMTVGDLVEGYNQPEPWLAQMREFRGIMDGLEMPWFPVAGNHDVYWRGPDRPPEEHEGRYEEHFGPLWYAFEHKDCWFVTLYTDEPNPETGERNFDKAECQRMSAEQLAWLDSILERSAEAAHVFVFVHHPRWIGGHYGDDWDRVHRRLVEAGNVSAVFGGHIHQMRYDPRDGIEYFALATVGGHQSGVAPRAGFLHQYHVVTVRDGDLSVVAYPVGQALDPRAITGRVNADMRRLAGSLTPRFESPLALAADGGGGGRLGFRLSNPTEARVEFEARLTTDDLDWSLDLDHVHGILEPGETQVLELAARRFPTGFGHQLRLPVLSVGADYLTADERFPLETRRLTVPAEAALPPLAPPTLEHALDLRDGGHARVPSGALGLDDGPFTVETWVFARAFAARQGLVAKTENSEYALFASEGRPEFSVHLDGEYAVVKPDGLTLEPERWIHLAGVYDGSELRLYVDGRLVGRTSATGARTRNDLPLIIGGDVDGSGRATSTLDGLLDELRLSEGVRYSGERFVPQRRLDADDDALLLLHMDGPLGCWIRDDSRDAAHALLEGSARVVPAS